MYRKTPLLLAAVVFLAMASSAFADRPSWWDQDDRITSDAVYGYGSASGASLPHAERTAQMRARRDLGETLRSEQITPNGAGLPSDQFDVVQNENGEYTVFIRVVADR